MFGGLGLPFTNGSVVITIGLLAASASAMATLGHAVLRAVSWIAITLNILLLLLSLYNALMVVIALDGSLPVTTLIASISIAPVAFTLALFATQEDSL